MYLISNTALEYIYLYDNGFHFKGGLSTHHEMCVALIEYYPRNRFMEQRCMSNMNQNGLPALFGAKNVTEMDDPDETWIIDSAGMLFNYRFNS